MNCTKSLAESTINSLYHLNELCADVNFGEKQKVFIKYVYDEAVEECFLHICPPANITRLTDVDDCPINKQRLAGILNEHALLFEDDLPPGKSKPEIWYRLYTVFIHPLLHVLPETFQGYIFAIFDDTMPIPGLEQTFFINIAHIYDLGFFHMGDNADNNISFINVSDTEPVRFIKKLGTAPLPVVADMDIIYGLPLQYNPLEDNHDDKSEQVVLAKFRENAFQTGMKIAGDQGARIIALKNIKTFEEAFSKHNTGRVVQLITHFHDNDIFTPNLSNPIPLGQVSQLADTMLMEDRLRTDIAIHAATCNNYTFFKKLYENGIKSIYYSANDLGMDEVAAKFSELYSGRVAKKIGFCFPYLDGKSFVFEAWQNVSRALAVNTYLSINKEIYERMYDLRQHKRTIFKVS